MKLRTNKSDLLRAIKCMTFPKSTLLLEVGKDVVLTSTDGTVVIKSQVEAEVIRPGTSCVSGPIFHDILTKIRGDVVGLEIKDGKMMVTGERSRVAVALLDAEAFPFQVEEPEEWIFTIDTQVMREAIKKTAHAIKSDKVPMPLRGLYIEAEGGNLSFMGCDTKQFALYQCELPSEEKFNCIIPREHIKLIENMLEGKEISFALTNYFAVFGTETHILYTRTVNAAYPPARKIIEKQRICQGEIDSSELIRAIELATITADATNTKGVKEIHITARNDGLEVGAKNELGTANDIISAEMTGEEVRVAYDATNLINALKAVGKHTVQVGFSGREEPMIIHGQGCDFAVVAVRSREVS